MIEFTIQSVQIDQQGLQEKLPALIAMMNSYLPKKKIPKRRKPRKKKIYLADKIQEIIDSIEKY
jgi:hypothetical protein